MASRNQVGGATVAGIVNSPDSGQRVIPESRRADGSVRKERRVKPGFVPVEDVARFRPSRILRARAEEEEKKYQHSSSSSSRSSTKVSDKGLPPDWLPETSSFSAKVSSPAMSAPPATSPWRNRTAIWTETRPAEVSTSPRKATGSQHIKSGGLPQSTSKTTTWRRQMDRTGDATSSASHQDESVSVPETWDVDEKGAKNIGDTHRQSQLEDQEAAGKAPKSINSNALGLERQRNEERSPSTIDNVADELASLELERGGNDKGEPKKDAGNG